MNNNLVCRDLCPSDDSTCNRACRGFRQTFTETYRINLDRRLLAATLACRTACGARNKDCVVMCVRLNALVRKYCAKADKG